MVVRLAHPSDYDAFRAYMLQVHVRVLADHDSYVNLTLMLTPKSRMHEEQELLGYVRTWNMLNPFRKVQVA